MVAKFIVLLVLLTFGSADPEPDPAIQINVLQKVDFGCGCFRCPCDKKTSTTPSPTTGISTTPVILICDEANIEANIARPNSTKLVKEISLAFVFDTTGSMDSELQQVKDGATNILNAIVSSSSSPIQDYILVKFNDPDVGPLTQTTNPNVFTTSINGISVNAGDDCPEMALGGIIMALSAVLPNSIIWVFTDATAKDAYLLPDVLLLIEDKSVQVNFLITGDCSGKYSISDESYFTYGYDYTIDDPTDDTTYETIYETIAFISSGQVYNINKVDVSVILDYITYVVPVDMVLLLSFEFEAGENVFDLYVDETLKEFTVDVSGTNPSIQIIGPGGAHVDFEVLVNLTNVNIVGVKNPAPGKYSITVKSDSKYTVRVMGDTSINFEYGFSPTPTADFNKTTPRPKAGEISYIIVKPTDLTDFGDFYRIQMITKTGTIVYDSSLKLISGYDDIYEGIDFMPPEEPFQIKIFGCDQAGNKFERLSPSFISAVSPGKTKMILKAITSGNSTSSAHKVQRKQHKDPRNYPEEQIHNQNGH